MPCPPSLEERGMQQNSYARSRISKMLKQYELEFPHSISCLESIVGEVDAAWKKRFKKELNRIKKRYAGLIKNKKLDLPKDKHEYSKSWPTMEDVDAMDRHNRQLDKVMRQLEIDLCKIRTLLMQYFIPNAELLTPELQEKLRKEKALHLLHRKEDIAAVLTDLDQQIHREMQGYLNQQGSGQPLRGLQHNYPHTAQLTRLKKAKNQLYQIYCLSEEEILKDREIEDRILKNTL